MCLGARIEIFLLDVQAGFGSLVAREQWREFKMPALGRLKVRQVLVDLEVKLVERARSFWILQKHIGAGIQRYGSGGYLRAFLSFPGQ